MASPTIKMLWGLAKSPELSMTDEELHLLVSAHTGKDSIRALNKRELGTMVSVLQNMKDSSPRELETDSGGQVRLQRQITEKVYKLTRNLGGARRQGSMDFVRRCFRCPVWNG